MHAIGAMELMLLLPFFGNWGLPLGMPPLPPDAVVQRAAPDECLYYLAWNGTAKPNADSPNRSEQLIANPEVQKFIAELGTQVTSALAQSTRGARDEDALTKIAPALLKSLAAHPAALYLAEYQRGGPSPAVRAGLVANLGGEVAEATAQIDRLNETLAARFKGTDMVQEVTIAGVKFKKMSLHRSGPTVLWGFKDSLFIGCVGEGEAKALVERLNKPRKTPTWLQDISKQLAIERPATVSYLNIAKSLEAFAPTGRDDVRAIEALGFKHLKSFTTATGLSGKRVASKARLVTDGEKTGVLAFLPETPLVLDDLKVVPREAAMAWALRYDAADALRRFEETLAAIDQHDFDMYKRDLGQLEQALGLNLMDDVLKPLGDSWALYSSPAEGANLLTGLALSVSLDDRAKLETANERILKIIREEIGRQGSRPEFTVKESSIGATKVYTLRFRMPVPAAPCWAFTDRHLIVTLNPQMMKTVLERKPDGGSLADVKSVQEILSAGKSASFLAYEDTQSMLVHLYGAVQMFGPMATGALSSQGIEIDLPSLPSLAKIKSLIGPGMMVLRVNTNGFTTDGHSSLPLNLNAAAVAPLGLLGVLGIEAPASAHRKFAVAVAVPGKNVAQDNLKQIALAMHTYQDTHKRLPAPAIYDKDGKPMLSWRVLLLPYLEQDGLYRAFHLDEPWDSEHNRKLIERMPKVYMGSDHPELERAGRTRFLLPTGAGALFQDDKGPRLKDITDGTSMTIMTVEAAPDRAVVWTKPDDLEIDPKNPIAALRSGRGSFVVGFADGSVHSFTEGINRTTLRRLFDPRDHQRIDPNSLPRAQ